MRELPKVACACCSCEATLALMFVGHLSLEAVGIPHPVAHHNPGGREPLRIAWRSMLDRRWLVVRAPAWSVERVLVCFLLPPVDSLLDFGHGTIEASEALHRRLRVRYGVPICFLVTRKTCREKRRRSKLQLSSRECGPWASTI